jgi:hypothetical protein
MLAARAGKVLLDTLGFAPPSHESEAPCTATPCLFNIEADPNEDHDLAGSMGTLAAELMAALRSAGVSGYLPVPGSDGTPTSDFECVMVQRTGSCQPWA